MENKNLENRLIRVERAINVYTKDGTEPLEEIDIEGISLDVLKTIVIPEESDPMLYDGYVLDSTQLERINELIEDKIKPNHELYNYILVCGGIYDWT